MAAPRLTRGRIVLSPSVPVSGGPSSALLKSVHNTLILSIHSNHQKPPRGPKRRAGAAGTDPAPSREEEAPAALCSAPSSLWPPVSHRVPSAFPGPPVSPRHVPDTWRSPLVAHSLPSGGARLGTVAKSRKIEGEREEEREGGKEGKKEIRKAGSRGR